MGSLIGSIIGNEEGGDARTAARNAGSEATGAYQSITPPSVDEQKVQLKLLQQMGVLSPELEQALTLAPSKMEDISTDPKIRDAQLQALETLRNLGNSGLSSQDMANLNAIRNDNNQQVNARNQSILQNQAARGTAGSGNELAMQLQASQSGANRASAQGDQLAADSQNRALQAIANSGTLAGQMNSQDFGQNAAKAQAADAISKFNTANSQDVSGRNVGRENQAQQYNLNEKQHIADSNVGIQNQQEMHNKALYQQQFQDQMARAQGLAGQLRQNQAQDMNESARQANFYSGIGQGVDKGAMAVAGAMSGGGSPGSLSPEAANANSNSAMIDNGYYGFGSSMGGGYAHGGMIPAYSDGGTVDQLAKMAPLAMMLLKDGGQVPGTPIVPGDSPINDVVPAVLSSGEVVVPNSVVNSDPSHIATFVQHAKDKNKHEIAMSSLTAIHKILKNLNEKR